MNVVTIGIWWNSRFRQLDNIGMLLRRRLLRRCSTVERCSMEGLRPEAVTVGGAVDLGPFAACAAAEVVKRSGTGEMLVLQTFEPVGGGRSRDFGMSVSKALSGTLGSSACVPDELGALPPPGSFAYGGVGCRSQPSSIWESPGEGRDLGGVARRNMDVADNACIDHGMPPLATGAVAPSLHQPSESRPTQAKVRVRSSLFATGAAPKTCGKVKGAKQAD